MSKSDKELWWENACKLGLRPRSIKDAAMFGFDSAKAQTERELTTLRDARDRAVDEAYEKAACITEEEDCDQTEYDCNTVVRAARAIRALKGE